MRWLVVGLSILALIVLGTLVWIANRFERTGAETMVALVLLAVMLGVGLAATGWQGWRLIQGIVVATMVLVGVTTVWFVLGSSLP
jgi:hypothetical protein